MDRILLVEDEDQLRELLQMNLEMENFEVVTAANGKKAFKIFNEQHFDLIILDIMLPDMDGLTICEQIRLRNSEIPIIFLTAKDAAAERVEGLKKGGDDYITKPFDLEELIIRIKNLLKRRGKSTNGSSFDNYTIGDYEINFKTFEAETNKGKITLTQKEALLLKLLIDRKNEVVSRNQILQAVWGYDVYPSTRTIDNFLLSFRKYFEPNPSKPKFFVSIRGIGYKYTEEN
ncbi:MAG: DNA-binding response regulator [Saprospirales bacterium]|nr:MAG: DNA-binding response regulator [Saprospirales bacterium]